MQWTTITKTQSDEAWLSDYIAGIIADEPSPLPPHDCRIGHVEAHWHQVSPGRAYIAANPEHGTPVDRLFAEAILRAQLEPHGYRQAVYTGFIKEAQGGWASPKVMDDAKRLVQSGMVHLDRNSPDMVVARVDGDGTDNDGVPDQHKVELHKDTNPEEDPANRQGKLTGMFCDCTWGQFMNTPRTRTWKQFQFTPCKHILAAYWASLSVPTDESRAPGNQGPEGQMSLFDMSGGQPGSQMGLMQRSPTAPPNAWFMQPGAPPNTFNQPMTPQPPGGVPGGPGGAPPSPADVLPPFPMQDAQLSLPQVNPASTPGGRPGPTPTNPLQYPGGTFSHVAQQQYTNGQVVRLNVETVGKYEGRPESGMAGESVTIPAGSVGEVLGTDPVTGMVNILFMGKQFETMGKLQPFGASAWCWQSEISPSANKPPGPAIRRLY